MFDRLRNNSTNGQEAGWGRKCPPLYADGTGLLRVSEPDCVYASATTTTSGSARVGGIRNRGSGQVCASPPSPKPPFALQCCCKKARTSCQRACEDPDVDAACMHNKCDRSVRGQMMLLQAQSAMVAKSTSCVKARTSETVYAWSLAEGGFQEERPPAHAGLGTWTRTHPTLQPVVRWIGRPHQDGEAGKAGHTKKDQRWRTHLLFQGLARPLVVHQRDVVPVWLVGTDTVKQKRERGQYAAGCGLRMRITRLSAVQKVSAALKRVPGTPRASQGSCSVALSASKAAPTPGLTNTYKRTIPPHRNARLPAKQSVLAPHLEVGWDLIDGHHDEKLQHAHVHEPNDPTPAAGRRQSFVPM